MNFILYISQYQFIYSLPIFNFNVTHAPISIYLSVYKFHSIISSIYIRYARLPKRPNAKFTRPGFRRVLASRQPGSGATFVRPDKNVSKMEKPKTCPKKHNRKANKSNRKIYCLIKYAKLKQKIKTQN